MLYADNNPLLAPAISFVFGFISGIIADPVKKYFQRTKLAVSLNPGKDIINTPDKADKHPTYFRIKLENKGKSKYAIKIKSIFKFNREKQNLSLLEEEQSLVGKEIAFIHDLSAIK